MDSSTLHRRALLAALPALALPALALPARALALAAPAATALPAEDQALVDRAVAYLQGLTAAQGRFTQTDARGLRTQGALYLQRPGKARFEYDAPSSLLVVSDGAVVAVADRRLKTVNRYPLGTTPLALFLAREIRLDRGVTVTRVARMADGFSITARDGKRETKGQITLDFTDGPIALDGWTVTDARNAAVRVSLTGLSRASGLDPALFRAPFPPAARSGRP